MSAMPAAPRIASVSACASTSPSEWPDEPTRMIDAHAAEHERNAVHERVRIEARADTKLAHPSGSCLRTRASNTLTVSRPFACANATATSKSSPTSGGSCASDASVTGAEERLSNRASG